MSVPSISPEILAEWRKEKVRLQKLLVDTQQRLQAVNQLVNAAVVLSGDAPEEPEESPSDTPDAIDPTNFMGTLARLINESPKPVQRTELKEMAIRAGVAPEKVNGAYFHVALNRMKDAKRITIRDDGSVWRGDRRI